MRDGTHYEHGWRGVVAMLLVPGTVALALTAAVLMMDAGVPPAAIPLPIAGVALVFVGLMERVLPWHRGWLRSQGDVGTDLLYLPTQSILAVLCAPAAAGIAIAFADTLASLTGGGVWPTHWPIAVQVVLASIVREFFDYWAHRSMHKVDWLWRLHATHHHPGRVYFLNGSRAHPLEIVYRFGFVGVVPLAMLGIEPRVLALTAVAALGADIYQHANVAIRLGPLSWLYSIGDAHRWHHSRARGEADTNYGNVYLFWDAVFGTRYLPRDREPPTDAGIEGLDAFPTTFFAQWISPWRWHEIVRASAADSPPVAAQDDRAPTRAA